MPDDELITGFNKLINHRLISGLLKIQEIKNLDSRKLHD